jgi:hypothetical protein
VLLCRVGSGGHSSPRGSSELARHHPGDLSVVLWQLSHTLLLARYLVVSLCLSLCVCVCVSCYVSLSLCLSLSVSLSLFLHLSLSHSHSPPHSLPPCLAPPQKLQGEVADLQRRLARSESLCTDLQTDLVSVRSDADTANSKMNVMIRRMTTGVMHHHLSALSLSHSISHSLTLSLSICLLCLSISLSLYLSASICAESENSAKAIQKAISSSVRLCVVAPTVNVHVADKKMKVGR